MLLEKEEWQALRKVQQDAIEEGLIGALKNAQEHLKELEKQIKEIEKLKEE